MKFINAKPKKTKRTLDPKMFERSEKELRREPEYRHLVILSRQLNISI